VNDTVGLLFGRETAPRAVAMADKRPGELLPPNPALIERLLDVIEHEIVPKTRVGVDDGNKIFGAAMLRKSDLSTIFVATNNETANPLNHGEISCINGYYAMVNADESKRVTPKDVLFLSTHEPCTLCSSAIAWSGFSNFYYFFSHEDSRDSFQIGHDLNILKQVFKHEPGGYARSNDYWTAYSIIDMIGACAKEDEARLLERVAAINRAYADMSETYQTTKDLCKNIALK
jgi:tRNA(Arg) A34 adenosine deaminase TadA